MNVKTTSLLLRFLGSFPLGFAIGAWCILGLGAYMEWFSPKGLSDLLSICVTTLGASLVAGVASAGVIATIENQNRLVQADRDRDERRAQAGLLATLAKLHKICEHGIFLQERIQDNVNDRALRKEMDKFTKLDDIGYQNLHDVLAITQDHRVHLRIAQVLEQLQLARARDDSMTRGNRFIGDKKAHGRVQWAYLQALAGSMYQYARFLPSYDIHAITGQRVYGYLAPYGFEENEVEKALCERLVKNRASS